MGRQRDYSTHGDWVNGSGYNDGTAGAALNRIMREQRKAPERRGGVWRAPEEKREINPIISGMLSGIDATKEGGHQNMITAKVERITPAMAAEYLEHNTENFRKARLATVARYANDIQTGKWQVNGETITFSESGVLKDGQHRLLAIIKAGMPAEILVVRGVSDDVKVYDSGQRRSVAQLAGVSYAAMGIANMVCAGFKNKAIASVGVAREYAETHHDMLMKAAAICHTGAKGGIVTARKSIMTAVYLLLRRGAVEDDVKEFIKVVNTGFSVDEWESSAAIAYANYVRKVFMEARYYRDVNCMAEVITVTISAFRDFAAGVKRTIAYRRPSDMSVARKYMDWIRKEDGLE